MAKSSGKPSKGALSKAGKTLGKGPKDDLGFRAFSQGPLVG